MTIIVRAALQLVAAHKVQQASLQLQRLGFAQWQAATAVQAAGCALHPAVQWLLEGHVSSQSQAQQLLQQQGAHSLSCIYPWVSGACQVTKVNGNPFWIADHALVSLPALPLHATHCGCMGHWLSVGPSCDQLHVIPMASRPQWILM
jgi:hypothetical protein